LTFRLPRLFDEIGYLAYPQVLDCFGIGIESGTVRGVSCDREQGGPSILTTFIGDPINIAARLEAHTKSLYRTPLIIGTATNDLLCERLAPGLKYSEVVAELLAANNDKPYSKVREVWRQLDEMNFTLGVKFISHLYLKGVDAPVAVFRYSPTVAGGEDRVAELVSRLFASRPAVVEGVRRALSPRIGKH